MFLDEAKPGAQPLDLLPGGGDPLPQQLILAFEQGGALPGLMEVGRGVRLPLPGAHFQLGLVGAHPPRLELLLERRKEALQLLELGSIRSYVG